MSEVRIFPGSPSLFRDPGLVNAAFHPSFDFALTAGYKVDVMEIASMTSLSAPSRRGHFNHSNRQDAREGGETPPLPRNCERTCLGSRPIGDRREQEFSHGFPHGGMAQKPLKASRRLAFGKAAEAGASQETGPRRLHPLCVPRGTEELSCLFPKFLRGYHAAIFAICAASLLSLCAALCSGSVHSRCGHRCHRRQSHRRQRFAYLQRAGGRLGGFNGRRQLPDDDRNRAASF